MPVENSDDVLEEDALLVHRTRLGHQAAFDQLVHKYQAAVSALVRSYVHNAADAEDLVQEVFITAYQKLGALQKPERFFLWLRQIAHNHCKNWCCRDEKRANIFEEINSENGGQTPSPEAMALQEERIALLWQSMDALRDTERQLLIGRYIEDASYEQLEAEFGLSYAALRNRLKRAKQAVRRQLQKTGNFWGLLPSWRASQLLSGGIEIMTYKVVTISMVVIGVGVFLLSLILPRYLWRDVDLILDKSKENQETAKTMAFQSSNNAVPREPLNKPRDRQEDKQIDKGRSLEGESATHPPPSEEIHGEEMSAPSGADSPKKNIDPEKVQAVVTQINESAENYRRILIQRRDLSLGLLHLYPEVDPVRYPGKELHEYIQAQVNVQERLEEYLALTNDYDAFNSGGWINQTFSGMMRMWASVESRILSMGFTDEMIRR